jgi:hypothetical protein
MKITKAKVNFTYTKEGDIYTFNPLNKKSEEFLNNIEANQFKISKNDYGFYLREEPYGGSLTYYEHLSLAEKEKLAKTLKSGVVRSFDSCIWPETYSLDDLEKLIDYMCERPGLYDE